MKQTLRLLNGTDLKTCYKMLNCLMADYEPQCKTSSTIKINMVGSYLYVGPAKCTVNTEAPVWKCSVCYLCEYSWSGID